MARVTVEDCIDKTDTRFELVMVAAQRARKIGSGAALTVERDNDKNPVVSLREIAAETVAIDDLKEELIRSHQRMVAFEDDDDKVDLMDGEEEWEKMAQRAALEERSSDIYADDNADEDDDEDFDREPSLEDLAGSSKE